MSAIKFGFTPSDLRTMSYPLLANMLDEWSLMNSSDQKGDVRMGTQADIDRMLA